MHTLTCKNCGMTFESKSANAFYCENCKVKVKKEQIHKHNLNNRRRTSIAWDIELFKKPLSGSMQRLYEISKRGVHYYEAKEKWEENKRDRKSKKQN